MSLKKSLSIKEWRTLSKNDIHLQVKIMLNGSSMLPLIRKNKDYVIIVPLYRQLLKGDIVLFKAKDNRYVVHRVWKLKDNKVLTIGDHCIYSDGWLPIDSIYGLVVKIERDSKLIVVDSNKYRALGRLCSLSLPFRRVLFQLSRIIKYVKRKNGKENG